MKAPHFLSAASVSILSILTAQRIAQATALPNGLYDDKACGGVPCFKVTNTSSSGSGSAIQGNATGSAGIGLWGFSTAAWGVYGVSNGTGSTAVGVVGTSGAGYGVSGTSTSGIGVLAKTSGNASNAAVDARSTTGPGTAVRAVVQGTGNGSAVWATGPNNGWGVYGEGNGTGYGVYGYNGNTGYGVYGLNTTGGYAVYSKGDLKVEGIPHSTTQSFFTIDSDIRLKKDVKPLVGALEQLLKLRGVTFEWKNPEEHGDMRGVQRGFIAQEVEKVLPEWVGEDAKGTKNLTTRGLEAMLVESLRTLKTDNDELRTRVKALENNRRALKAGLSDNAWSLGGLIVLGGVLVFSRRQRQTKRT